MLFSLLFFLNHNTVHPLSFSPPHRLIHPLNFGVLPLLSYFGRYISEIIMDKWIKHQLKKKKKKNKNRKIQLHAFTKMITCCLSTCAGASCITCFAVPHITKSHLILLVLVFVALPPCLILWDADSSNLRPQPLCCSVPAVILG